jgi:eukaryotic-like serine/threonine-protein kinase
MNRRFFGNYRIVTTPDGQPVELARDGAIVTYQGEHSATGDQVRLTLIPQSAIERGALPAFEAEMQSAQVVEHPNISGVRQMHRAGELFVCASEFHEGETLQAWVEQHGPLPVDTAIRIGAQVLGALAAAAFHAVRHGSLRPENLMIVPGTTPAGEWPLVKVLNFGLWRAQTPPTPFSSPEQLTDGHVDFRSDVYSLGATLWFLVSGAPPVSADAVENSTGIHGAFRELIARMLATNPEDRPQDPVVLVEMLQDCLDVVGREPVPVVKPAAPVAPVIAMPVLTAAPRKLPVKPLAIAAVLLLVGLAAAMLVPRAARSVGLAEPKPLGVPIGVPERQAPAAEVAPAAAPAPAAPAVVQNDTSTMRNEVRRALPPDAADEAPEAAGAAGVLPQTGTALAQNTSRAVNAQAEASPEAEADPPQLVQEDPAPPAEGPQVAESAPAAVTEDESTTGSGGVPAIAERPRVAAAARQPSAEEPSQRPSTTTARKRSEAPTTARQQTRTARRSELPVRRAEPVDEMDEDLPPIRRGQTRARFRGTTAEGDLVFEMPSNEPVYVAPPPADLSRLSPRQRLRRALFGRSSIAPPPPPPDVYYDEDEG